MSQAPGVVGFSSPLFRVMFVSPTAANAKKILLPTGRGQPRPVLVLGPADANPDEPLVIRLLRSRCEGVIHGLAVIALEDEVVWLFGARISGLEVRNVQLPRAPVVPTLAALLADVGVRE